MCVQVQSDLDVLMSTDLLMNLFQVNSSHFFKEINNSDPSDWLLNHKEIGQSFDDFESQCFARGIELSDTEMGTKFKRKTIFILPLGAFPSDESRKKSASNPLLSWLESYCAAFFNTSSVSYGFIPFIIRHHGHKMWPMSRYQEIQITEKR